MIKTVLLFIFQVILLIVFICQPIAFVTSSCRLFYKSSSKMNLKSITILRADKLYDTLCSYSLKKLALASQCIKMEQCYYLTIDKKNNICSFYNQCSTFYNTTNLQTYILELISTAVWTIIILLY